MKKFKKFFNIKRVLSSLVALSMLLSVFNFASIEIHADSDELIPIFLSLSQGTKMSSVENLQSLTNDDLRLISLFLSNFYLPWGTALDSEEAIENNQEMTEVLQNMGFDRDAAVSLTEMAYESSLNTATKLYINVDDLPDLIALGREGKDNEFSNDAGNTNPTIKGKDNDPALTKSVFDNTVYKEAVGDYLEGDDGNKYVPLTLFMFYALMDEVAYKNGGVKYKFYRSEGGKVVTKNSNGDDIVSFTIDSNFIIYYSCIIGKMDASNGLIGNALFNGNSKGDLSGLGDSEILNLLSFTQNMYIDWVGNVIVDFGDRRVIAVPAVLNLNTFVSIDNNIPTFVRGSSFGIYMLNDQYLYDWDKKMQYFTQKIINYKRDRGNTDDVKWVKSAGETRLKDLCTSLGIDTGVNSVWPQHVINVGAYQTYRWSYNNGTQSKIIDWDDNFSIKNGIGNYYTLSKLVTNDSIGEGAEFTFGDTTLISYNIEDISDFKGKYFTSKSKFSTTSKSFGSIMTIDNNDYKILSDIFITYLILYNNHTAPSYTPDAGQFFDVKFNADAFPITDKAFQWTTTNVTADEISSFIYYLLHPTKGIDYVATLFKNKISGIIVSWHEDIVGNTSSNATTGMTQYLGFNGYITVSSLADIEWTAWLLNIYNSLIIYLIIIMCIILTCYVIVGQITLQRGFVGLVTFAILIFFPPVAINATVDTVNRISDSIYSSKFDYWALVQNQAYLGQLDLAINASTTGEYISALLSMNVSSNNENALGGSSNQTFSGVRLKWMTPKRSSDTYSLKSSLNSIITSSSGISDSLLNIITNSSAIGNATESYVQSDNAKYLYRDYMDIYRHASVLSSVYDVGGYNFGGTSSTANSPIRMVASGSGQSIVGNTAWANVNNEYLVYSNGIPIQDGIYSNLETTSVYSGLSEAVRGTSSLVALRHGFLWHTVDTSAGVYYTENTLAPSMFLLNSKPTIDIAYNYKNFVNNFKKNVYRISYLDVHNNNPEIMFGISPNNFNMSLADYVKLSDEGSSGLKDLDTTKYSYLIWGLYSESPFYYFNNNVRDQMKTANTGYVYNKIDLANKDMYTNHVKNLFLDNNQEVFFNMSENAGDGYGELRDFMNMHDFFYYVMPCLQIGVNLTDAYDEVFGMYLYDDCSLSLNSDGSWMYNGYSFIDDSAVLRYISSGIKDEELYKFWHDFNVYTIFNSYTTWLDTMNDCDYADAETINVAGNRFLVTNPLDPMTYFSVNDNGEMVDGRYMIFSRSEMAYYGLNWNDLTTVEQKILTVQDNVYKNALDLMNYYTLSDEVLIQAYAMLQLFEFNKEFSQTSLISKDYILYPQGYELKAFTYDAYLRLILTESSGENLMTSNADTENISIYQRILQKTSIFFGIVLLVNDFIAVYVIPALRLFFIVAIFLMSIAMIISAAVKLNDEANRTLLSTTWHSLIAPLVSFGVTTIGLAFIVSLFMSDGATGVVDKNVTIKLGDPTMVVFIMCIINAVCVILYYKICKKCTKDLVGYIKAIGTSVGGAVIGASAALAKSLSGKANGFTRGLVGGAVGAHRRNKLLKTIKEAGGSGDSDDKSGSYDANKSGAQNDPRNSSNLVSGAVGAFGGYSLANASLNGASEGSGSSESGTSSDKGMHKPTQQEKGKKYDTKAKDNSNVRKEGGTPQPNRSVVTQNNKETVRDGKKSSITGSKSNREGGTDRNNIANKRNNGAKSQQGGNINPKKKSGNIVSLNERRDLTGKNSKSGRGNSALDTSRGATTSKYNNARYRASYDKNRQWTDRGNNNKNSAVNARARANYDKAKRSKNVNKVMSSPVSTVKRSKSK